MTENMKQKEEEMIEHERMLQRKWRREDEVEILILQLYQHMCCYMSPRPLIPHPSLLSPHTDTFTLTLHSTPSLFILLY